jgi:hypothetical protein
MPEINTIERLKEYLSTEKRQIVFLYYTLKPNSPSDIAKNAKIPLSSVDRITDALQISGILEKVKEEDKKKLYQINWFYWVSESLNLFKLSSIDEEIIKNIEDILKNPIVFSFHYLISFSNKSKLLERIFQTFYGITTKSPETILFEIRKPEIIFYPLLIITNSINHANPYSKLMSQLFKKHKVEKKSKNIFLKIINEEMDKEDYLKNEVGEIDNNKLDSMAEKTGQLDKIILPLLKSMKK